MTFRSLILTELEKDTTLDPTVNDLTKVAQITKTAQSDLLIAKKNIATKKLADDKAIKEKATEDALKQSQAKSAVTPKNADENPAEIKGGLLSKNKAPPPYIK